MPGVVIPFPQQRVSMRQMTRRERIEFLLDHYEDFFLISAQGGGAGDGSMVPGLPRMSRHKSVVELCRCLHDLSVFAPLDYAVLKGFYTAERRIALAAKKEDVPAGQRERTFYDQKRKAYPFPQRVLSSWIRQELWRRDRAVSWIAWERGEAKLAGMPSVKVAFKGEVFIPTDLLDAAA